MKNKENLSQTPAAIKQRKRRAEESLDECKLRLAKDRENKRIKKSLETSKQSESRLARNRTQKHRERQRRVLECADKRLNRQVQQPTDNFQPLSESDRKLLSKFRTEVNKLEYEICPVCNERFPSITLVLGMCRHCYNKKNDLKKFSAANNMDPDDVPEELKGLTEIEEMLISQTFPIISVYYLRGGQYAYSENVINFSQDIGEFVSRLPRHPSTLDTFVVRRYSAERSTSLEILQFVVIKLEKHFVG